MSDTYQQGIDTKEADQTNDAGVLYNKDNNAMQTLTSNFHFIKTHDPVFFQLASAAEQFFAIDPNTTIVKLRQLSEALSKEVVSQVESLFTLADTLEEKIEAAKKRVNKLTQSILAKAFRGELVAQDTNDESAEKLLERIKPKKTRGQKG